VFDINIGTEIVGVLNRVMRIFEPMRDSMTGDWRKVHFEERLNLFFWPSACINGMVKSRRIEWAGYMPRMGDRRRRRRRIMVGHLEKVKY
jgi:hypothetical protein